MLCFDGSRLIVEVLRSIRANRTMIGRDYAKCMAIWE